MKYIRNNKLFLGTKFLTIKNNLDDIIQYIYSYYHLDYDKMGEIYEHIELENNYDQAIDFKNNLIEDNKYIYKRYKLHTCNFKNKKLIKDLNNYLKLNKTKDLKLNNINKIKLINDSGIAKRDFASLSDYVTISSNGTATQVAEHKRNGAAIQVFITIKVSHMNWIGNCIFGINISLIIIIKV